MAKRFEDETIVKTIGDQREIAIETSVKLLPVRRTRAFLWQRFANELDATLRRGPVVMLQQPAEPGPTANRRWRKFLDRW